MMFKRYSRKPFFLLMSAVGFLLLTAVPGYCPKVALTTIFVDEEDCISTCQELQDMQNDLTADYCLDCNIDCSMTTTWNGGDGFVPIGNSNFIGQRFTGTFDGRGYKITGLYINEPDTSFYAGLFGVIDGSEIKNVGLENVDIRTTRYAGALVGKSYSSTITNSCVTGTSVVSGSGDIGGLVGRADGSTEISVSYSEAGVNGWNWTGGLVGSLWGSAEINNNSYATGDVQGNEHIGGLVGKLWDSSEIKNSHATGDVQGINDQNFIGGLVGSTGGNSITDSYATGAVGVGGNKFVGGLVGRGSPEITDSYATGTINGSRCVGGLVGDGAPKIVNSYATGDVTGPRYAGGLIGRVLGSVEIDKCYATGIVTGTWAWVGGLVGEVGVGGSLAISDSYVIGNISGGDFVGGLVGTARDITITNSYSVGSQSGSLFKGGLVGQAIGGGTRTSSYWNTDTGWGWDNSLPWEPSPKSWGKTTTEMQTESTFTGWAFESVPADGATWKLDTITPSGNYYPCLSWQGNGTCPKQP